MSGIAADFTGAFRKTEALKMTGKALRFQVSKWAAETVQLLKRSAASMQKGAAMGHKKSGSLARSVGMKVAGIGGAWSVRIGTGIGTVHDLKYPEIQDKGGRISAKNAFFIIQNVKDRPRQGPFLTVPLRGIQGRASNYPGAFAIRTKTGKYLLVAEKWKKVRGGENFARVRARAAKGKRGAVSGIVPLFVLKRFVDIPPSYWFTGVIDRREPDLREMIDPAVVYNIASQMAGRGGA